ncbi:MAG: hypothetical protein JWO48_2071 [Bryobacterales bacterium]|nr:hypothetical protein [Bryobacterales bacterium]
MDVYLSGPDNQIHDLNPSAFPPVGLFWTIEISEDDSEEQEGDNHQTGERGSGVEVEFGSGSASMRVSNAPILDYGTIQNALFGGGPPPVPGAVSFKVVWSGGGQKVNIRNTDPVFGGFEGEFIRETAQMEWTARVGNYTFASDALATSSSSFAEIGRERNGSFFK